MSQTSTISSYEQAHASPPSLSGSLGSLGSPRRSSSRFSKSYKVASSYFLTRRFAEALWTIQPLLEINASDDHGHGSALIATADRKWRIKIWSLYTTLHDSIIDLGAKDGKATIGAAEWAKIVAKVADGSLWEEVVRVGYGNDESVVDAEVVLNIANLLLAHSPNQSANQHHLETYLSSAPVVGQWEQDERAQSDASKAVDYQTNLMRDLETRIQIIEVFALHVLPSNDEWEYARTFIRMSDVLDEDRKEAFIESLSELEGVDEHSTLRSVKAPEEESAQGAVMRGIELSRADSEVTIIPAKHSSHDAQKVARGLTTDPRTPIDRQSELQSLSPDPVSELDDFPTPKNMAPSSDPKIDTAPSRSPVQSRSSDSLMRRSFRAWTAASTAVSELSVHLCRNPFVLWRFVLFLSMIVVAYSRRDLRQKLRRLLREGLEKLRGTLGMGMKVSYI